MVKVHGEWNFEREAAPNPRQNNTCEGLSGSPTTALSFTESACYCITSEHTNETKTVYFVMHNQAGHVTLSQLLLMTENTFFL